MFRKLPLIAAVLLSAAAHAQNKPNVLVIMADDVGWSDPSCYHQGVMSSRTPNIDRLAGQGMRFTDYYAQPSCTAGRSAFLTGQFPARTGLHTVGLPGGPAGLSPKDPTLANVMKSMGYTTGQFGKNHLGDRNAMLPTVHGFDEYWGWLYHLNAMEYTEDFDWPKGELIKAFAPRNLVHCWAADSDDPTEQPRWGRIGKQRIEDDGPCSRERMKTLDDEVTAKTIDFMQRAVAADTPFFLWMCPARAHIFTHLKEEYEEMLGQDGMGLSQVALKELDDNVGKVLDEVDQLGIADNTIVVFTSDNGPEIITWPDGGMTPFRGEKGTTWEGGFRVPAIIRWPGKIAPGQVCNEIFDSMDWVPTLVAAVGGPTDLPDLMRAGSEGYKVHLDGYNQLDLLTGKGPSARKEIVYYEGTTLQAARYGDWKAHFIIQPHGWFGPKEKLNGALLFNLRRDPYERAAEESGEYVDWLAHKMWAFGPAQTLVKQHLMTFAAFPSRKPSAASNQEEMKEQMSEGHTQSQ